MTTGKTIALTRWIFVGKVMSLLFNMLSRLVITFFPRSKRPLISWLQSPSAVILEPPKVKSVTVSTVSPSICHEVIGPDAMILVFGIWVLSQLFPLSSLMFLFFPYISVSLHSVYQNCSFMWFQSQIQPSIALDLIPGTSFLPQCLSLTTLLVSSILESILKLD